MNSTSQAVARNRQYGPALLCTALFLLCELVTWPVAEMGIADDWSYFKSALALEHTGHIVYNGWATAMVGAQLYLGALFLRLFGDSYTCVRLSTLFLAACTVFLMQRIFFRCGASALNASFAALTVAFSPVFFQISATYMTDLPGMFGVVICAYGCIRALQAYSEKAALGWIAFAVGSNVVMGSARQIAWLGALVMVPSTLWLLRKQKTVFRAGLLATLLGWVAIFACMRWFARQPWAIPEHALPPINSLHAIAYVARQWSRSSLEAPLLILPLVLAFLVAARRQSRRFWITLGVLGTLYAAAAYAEVRLGERGSLLQPLMSDWFDVTGFYRHNGLHGREPVVLTTGIRVLLTVLWLVGSLNLLWIVARICRRRMPRLQVQTTEPASTSAGNAIRLREVVTLTVPVLLAYFGLLLPRSSANLWDRYLLPVEFLIALPVLLIFQEFVRPSVPRFAFAALAIVAIYSVTCTHDLFSLYRARVKLAEEMRVAGIPANSVDGGTEFNAEIELQAFGHLNDPTITNPPGSYMRVDPSRGMTCYLSDAPEAHDATPHLVPRYAAAYDASACAGTTSLTPVPYSRWQLLRTDRLYLVNLQPR